MEATQTDLIDAYLESENCMTAAFANYSPKDVHIYMARLVEDVETEISRRCPSYVMSCKYSIKPFKKLGLISRYYIWFTSKQIVMLLSGKDYDGKECSGSLVSSAELIADSTLAVDTTAFDRLISMDWTTQSSSYRSKYEVPVYKDVRPSFTRTCITQKQLELCKTGTLVCNTVLSDTFNVDSLLTIFEPYKTSGSIRVVKTASGKAYIYFTNKTDAHFALCMCDTYKDIQHKITLCFDYAKSRH